MLEASTFNSNIIIEHIRFLYKDKKIYWIWDEFVYKKKYKQFQAGDIKQGLVEAALEKMEKLKAAVLAFDTYQELMKKHSRYDFDDMINWVNTAFKENKNLLV